MRCRPPLNRRPLASISIGPYFPPPSLSPPPLLISHAAANAVHVAAPPRCRPLTDSTLGVYYPPISLDPPAPYFTRCH